MIIATTPLLNFHLYSLSFLLAFLLLLIPSNILHTTYMYFFLFPHKNTFKVKKFAFSMLSPSPSDRICYIGKIIKCLNDLALFTSQFHCFSSVNIVDTRNSLHFLNPARPLLPSSLETAVTYSTVFISRLRTEVTLTETFLDFPTGLVP